MKIAYLTIDDAPSNDFKRKVDYLLSKSIPAIFFCRGNLMEKRPEVVTYAIKKVEGIRVGMWEIPLFHRREQQRIQQEIMKRGPRRIL